MKPRILIIVLICFCELTLFAQTERITSVMTLVFTKKIEPNYKIENPELKSGDKAVPEYNTDGKKDVERLFFGDFNAPIEYFMTPPFDGSYGFRVVNNAADTSYKLEVKYISNFTELDTLLEKEFPTVGLPLKQMLALSEEWMAHNEAMWQKESEEKLKRYDIKTFNVPVSTAFEEALYGKVVSTMDTLAMEKKIPGKMLDPDIVTFRCIVGDDLWSLIYRNPDGEIGRLSNLCNLIIKDVQEGTFDETKYIKLLR